MIKLQILKKNTFFLKIFKTNFFFKQVQPDFLSQQYKSKQANISLMHQQSDEQIQLQNTSGFQAIVGSRMFSNKVSSLYRMTITTFTDQNKDQIVVQKLQEIDKNIHFLINICPLWLELRYRIKSKVNFFKSSSDHIVVKYSLLYASMYSLCHLKQSIIVENLKPLRKAVREYLAQKLKNQQARTKAIYEQLGKSTILTDFLTQKKQKVQELQTLKNKLANMSLQQDPLINSYLKYILEYVFKAAHKQDSEFKPKMQDSQSQKKTLLKLKSKKQIQIIMLIVIYLRIYSTYQSWMKILIFDRQDKIKNLFFQKLSQENGLHIVKRVLDDAPLVSIHKELQELIGIFFKKT